MSDVFRVGIETDGGRVCTNYDDITAEQVTDLMRRYAERDGDGIHSVSGSGAAFWPWEQVHAIRVVRGHFTTEEYP
ncbi:hypothetical protein AMIS_19780 [Actinoplanes missouriensis 431]|uniref:Uncharacterized protein n=1 Tax=Actinoplanes missouriensis (strain ATCC 14538 / DSM 43046 / CBS 188.64 / JCM 3121 / NBRC 102363 / NCIMB 12654 / NRRL B-3342 / UNCC 431) TaxID=512565 RepID=I0H2G1_ACTM4|nr:hypothetical protein [Actinoplanes missouriensis]BAL87198.1 hypothetical protein AMIS_19780 [Actinoplanes missouriensis 431]